MNTSMTVSGHVAPACRYHTLPHTHTHTHTRTQAPANAATLQRLFLLHFFASCLVWMGRRRNAALIMVFAAEYPMMPDRTAPTLFTHHPAHAAAETLAKKLHAPFSRRYFYQKLHAAWPISLIRAHVETRRSQVASAFILWGISARNRHFQLCTTLLRGVGWTEAHGTTEYRCYGCFSFYVFYYLLLGYLFCWNQIVGCYGANFPAFRWPARPPATGTPYLVCTLCAMQ
ncbi:hypothetical protein F4802DRAFT_256316 [Xylaria palmicola]|nr:hypothetical protein F4802DRAFT_256316 [Xylaria palmicola]